MRSMSNESFHSIFSILLAPVYCYGGYFGNYIFFMISGLLISSHYKKKICQKEIPFKTQKRNELRR